MKRLVSTRNLSKEDWLRYEDLYHKGIRLVFLKEHHIDTDYKYKRQIRAKLIAEQDLPKGASIFYEPPKSF